MDNMANLQLLATTTFGLEACVKRELRELGFEDPKGASPGRIRFMADSAGLARANLWLRTAERVLLVIGTFEAKDFGQLFDGTYELPWHEWIPADGSFPVTGRSYNSQLSSVPACQKIVKKAIVEKLLAAHKVNSLPETGPTYSVEVALRKDAVTLTIDTSGPGLHKRGYRAAAGPAPLRETIAAAMIQLSFWRPDRQLVDPFCGSGTIPIEAALIGRNIAPGLNRNFAAEKWERIPADVWAGEREKAREKIKPALPVRIIGTDIEPKAISLSAYHAKLAGVEDDIHFQQQPFENLTSSKDYGCVICNPPYGQRFKGTADITGLYKSMADVFKTLGTWSFFVLTSVELEKILGQTADRRRKLYNGQIECAYYQFHGPRPPRPDRAEPPAAAEKAVAEPPQDLEQAEVAEAKKTTPAAPPAPAFGGLKENADNQAEVFANRLRKMARHMRRWPTRRAITCYRLYDRDIPEIPLAVDIYEGRLHIVEYDRPHDRTVAQHTDWLEMIVGVAGEVLGVDRPDIFLKRRQRQRGADQYGKFADASKVFTVTEGGLKFEVNLSDYIDTGLFLDHRITRDMVRADSGGKRMLNLFAYTGAFSVYAADGGAKSTATVDLSNTYLDWAYRNLIANNFTGSSHKLIRADVMEFLGEHAPGPHYDLAIIDPPTFSNSKRTDDVFDIQVDYNRLIHATVRLMSPGGVIYFSTNFRRFKFDAGAFPALDAKEISAQTIPEDFRNKRIHRCWRITVG